MITTRRTVAWITTVCLMAGLCIPVHAETNAAVESTPAPTVQAVTADDYQTYLENNGEADYPLGRWEFGSDYITDASEQVTTNGTAEALTKDEVTEKRSPVSLFTQNDTYAEWTIPVETAGYYRLAVKYCGLDAKQLDIEAALTINGAVPFGTTARFLLPRSYKDDGSIYRDGMDNDVRPMKVEVMEWTERALQDKDGVYSEPYAFYFAAGENKLRLEMVQAGIAVESIVLYNDPAPVSYEEYNSQNKADTAKTDSVSDDTFLKIEGENAHRVTHTVLNASYDKMSAISSPQHASKLRLNTIGAGNWKMPGQTITWQVEVTEPGYYQLGMRARQNLVRGFFSSRNIYVDGELLFEEMQEVQIDYSSGWQMILLGDENPYEIYLTEGKHTITMEAVGGVIGTSVQEFESIIFDLNEMYRNMIMITGTSPDNYRDYKLEQEIPDLHERMKELITRLREAKATMEGYSASGGSNVVTAEQLAQQLESFIEKPRSVPSRISSFQGNISSLSGYVMSLKEQPLEIDYLFLKSPEKELPQAEADLFTQFIFRCNAFFASFFEDYSQFSDEEYDESALTVWVSLGRDQTQIVKDLTENFFTPEHNVQVNLSLVQQGIVEAIAAGKGPDVLLYTDSATPVNLAARNQLADLSKMEGFEEVKSWFTEGIMNPFTYNGGVYALPLQQSVSMLFCRTDILEELGVSVPKTWDEFYLVTRQIQKKKLEVGIPAGSATAPDNSMFDTLLFQNDTTYYNEDHSATLFDTEEAMAAFKQWTEFYTKYGLNVEFDFLNRFRSGQMPMAIQGYMTYSTLAVAAPEIRGLWSMSILPGTAKEDGTVDHTAASGVTVAIMLKKTENKEAAFEFMKWYASADTQTEYGLSVENILGEGGRYSPANLEALENMNWSSEELEKIYEQVTNSKFVPNIPATYYVTRNITNAFRAVVVKGEVPREALNSYNMDINSEIKRKRIELGLE